LVQRIERGDWVESPKLHQGRPGGSSLYSRKLKDIGENLGPNSNQGGGSRKKKFHENWKVHLLWEKKKEEIHIRGSFTRHGHLMGGTKGPDGLTGKKRKGRGVARGKVPLKRKEGT